MTRAGKIIAYAILVIWAAICILPIYWVAITSLKSVAAIDKPQGYLPFIDFAPSLESWRFILLDQSENLVTRFLNSIVIGIAATVITVTVSGMAIYGLTRFPPALRWTSVLAAAAAAAFLLAALLLPGGWPRMALGMAAIASAAAAVLARGHGPAIGGPAFVALILATRILPPVTLVIPLFLFAAATGMRDTITFMVLVYAAINIPVAVWLLLPVFGTRAMEQEEAAQLDGASHVGIFFTILLPMVRASIAAAGLVVFLLCWNEYLLSAILTADHALTLPPWAVGQLSMKEAQTGGEAEEWAHLSAATILMMIPALAFAAFVQKHLGKQAAKQGA